MRYLALTLLKSDVVPDKSYFGSAAGRGQSACASGRHRRLGGLLDRSASGPTLEYPKHANLAGLTAVGVVAVLHAGDLLQIGLLQADAAGHDTSFTALPPAHIAAFGILRRQPLLRQ